MRLNFRLPVLEGDLKTIFGTVLREYRTTKELTQQQLADFAAMDRAYISELERGLLMPSLETFFKLSYELKVKPQDFVARIDQEMKGRQEP